MNNGVSIIICCFNSSQRLKETLKHIYMQECSCHWELIVIDNASTDNTFEYVLTEALKQGKKLSFQIFREEKPGKQYAIKKGVLEAKYEYILICDDDNWLSKNYVQTVFEIFQGKSDCGAIGGLGIPETESKQLPEWFSKFVASYAAFPQAQKSGYIGSVYGAGMAFRKSIFNKIYNSTYESLLTCRKGDSLDAGGDSEMCYQIRLAGYQIWYDEKLTFHHFIPSKRITWDYLKKLHIGFAKSSVTLDIYDKVLNGKPISNFYWLKQALYFLGIYVKYWAKHYNVYKKGQGSNEEILHITWRTIRLEYLKCNFSTIGYYNRIIAMKKKLNE